MRSRSPSERRNDRRRSRKMAELAALGFEPPEISPLTTESLRIDRKRYKVSKLRPAMGTLVAVSVLHGSRGLADEAVGRAYEAMDRLIGLLNRYDPSSALACLNDRGRLSTPPPELAHVVERGLRFHRISGGAFDISVKPLVDLYRDDRTAEALAPPDRRQLAAAVELVGSDGIDLSPRGIVFDRTGMGITLDGIAKGYIVDEMAATLLAEGATAFLINAGGDVRTAGARDGRQPWTVAVQDPDKEDRFPGVVELEDGALATSGSYEIHFDRERLFHHIVDANRGGSPRATASVTVRAPTTLEADALATAAFVMEPDRAVAFIDRMPGCECLILGRRGRGGGRTRRLRSRGWRARPPGPASTGAGSSASSSPGHDGTLERHHPEDRR